MSTEMREKKKQGGDSSSSSSMSSAAVLSMRTSLFLCLLGMAVSFLTGQVCRPLFLSSSSKKRDVEGGHNNDDSLLTMQQQQQKEASSTVVTILPNGETMPLHDDDEVEEEEEDSDDSEDDNEHEQHDDDDDEIKPLGQHLLIDIKNPDLLGSIKNHPDLLVGSQQARLRKATTRFASRAGLSLQESLQCYKNGTTTLSGGGGGFTCLASMRGTSSGHLLLHTAPTLAGGESLLWLDLFVTEWKGIQDNELAKTYLPIIKESFATPHSWMQKKRGLDRAGLSVLHNYEQVDFDVNYLGYQSYPYKQHVATVETKFQTIDVLDVVDPIRRDRQSDDDIDRVIFLDTIVQSRRFGEAAYHEALVHPAMFAHSNPKRVAIIGGGEGATLREILKHATVEKVVMVEIDEVMVNVSREYLPEWSDCGGFAGESEPSSCFENSRTEMYYQDAIAWFIDRFGGGKEEAVKDEDRFDVIFMDALDPTSVCPFSDVLYGNKDFLKSLQNALTDNGILAAQVGEADYPFERPPNFDVGRDGFFTLIDQLEKLGFASIRSHVEGSGGFRQPWSYLVGFMGSSHDWHDNAALMQLKIQQRILPNAAAAAGASSSPLRYFDGASMMTYEFPDRLRQETFCRNQPQPPACRAAGFTTAAAAATSHLLLGTHPSPRSHERIQSTLDAANGRCRMGLSALLDQTRQLAHQPPRRPSSGQDGSSSLPPPPPLGGYVYNPFLDRKWILHHVAAEDDELLS